MLWELYVACSAFDGDLSDSEVVALIASGHRPCFPFDAPRR